MNKMNEINENSEEMDELIKEIRRTLISLGFIVEDKTSKSEEEEEKKSSPLLKTEDGMCIYTGDPVFQVVYDNPTEENPLWSYDYCSNLTNSCPTTYKYFALKENLLQFIKENKLKAIKIKLWEQAEFLITYLSKDKFTESFNLSECIEIVVSEDGKSIEWYSDSNEYYEEQGYEFISFWEYIKYNYLSSSWLNFISKEAEEKGLINKTKFKWISNSIFTRTAILPFCLDCNGDLTDSNLNLIFSQIYGWPPDIISQNASFANLAQDINQSKSLEQISEIDVEEETPKLSIYDLIPGEIYTSVEKNPKFKIIYRFKGIKNNKEFSIKYFSSAIKHNRLNLNDWCMAEIESVKRFIRFATKKEKKKLIKKEVLSGYFYKL